MGRNSLWCLLLVLWSAPAWAGALGVEDRRLALQVAQEYTLTPWQTQALLCLRSVENGAPGREYGVLHPRALNTTHRNQAQWAAGSIKKRLHGPTDITSFSRRWCPVGALNDPTGLNVHFEGNFRACLRPFVGQDT